MCKVNACIWPSSDHSIMDNSPLVLLIPPRVHAYRLSDSPDEFVAPVKPGQVTPVLFFRVCGVWGLHQIPYIVPHNFNLSRGVMIRPKLYGQKNVDTPPMSIDKHWQ